MMKAQVQRVEVKRDDRVLDMNGGIWKVVEVVYDKHHFQSKIIAVREDDNMIHHFDLTGKSSEHRIPNLNSVFGDRRTLDRIASYEAVDSEIKYAEKWDTTLSSGRVPKNGEKGGDRTIDEWILYIRGYAEDLAKIGAHENNPKVKLDFIRKVAGLCVKCMDQHGAPLRVIHTEQTKGGEA